MELANTFGVLKSRISEALTVCRYAPGLADAVLAKEMRLDEACQRARALKAEAEINQEEWAVLAGNARRKLRRNAEVFLPCLALAAGEGGGDSGVCICPGRTSIVACEPNASGAISRDIATPCKEELINEFGA